MQYYTYAYLREDGTPYYIGKGKGDRAYKKCRTGAKPPKDKSRIILLKQNLTEEESFKHEKYMIAVFGRKDLGTGILHNLTDGGEGSSGFKHSEKTKNKMRNRTYSPEARAKISVALKNRTHSPETRAKISVGNIGKTHSAKARAKMRSAAKNRTYSLEARVKRGKTYKITFDDGNSIIIKSLKTWSKENGYSPSCLRNMYDGKQKKHKNIVSVEIVEA